MMDNRNTLATAAIGALMLGGCTTLEGLRGAPSVVSYPELNAVPLERRLPVVRAPTFRGGDSFTYRFQSGAQQVETVVSARGDRVVWSIPSGAQWTTVTGTMFNTAEWSSTAGYGSGRQRFNTISGSLFPMRVGNVLHYNALGESSRSAGTWTQRWSCTVPSEERIRVVAGVFDTYRVICYRAGQLRTYYYAPEVGNYVLRVTTGRDSGRKELVSYSRAR